MISDNDEQSVSKLKANSWESKFVRGKLIWDESARRLSVQFDTKNTKVFRSKFNSAGRGMELSELIYYDSVLTSFDDKTGIVYKIEQGEIYPWIILASGDGKLNKGFKSEWATVKDGKLFVGSHGTTMVADSTPRGREQLEWIKIVSHTGTVEHVNWIDNYGKLQNRTECSEYLTHEAVCWSDTHKKWFFLPRKCSKVPYSSDTYDEQSSNILLSCDESFENINVVQVGNAATGQGFSSFKFLPDSKDTVLVALKTQELNSRYYTYISGYSLEGEILLEDTLISDRDKFEGLEFIHPYDPILNYTAPDRPSSSTHLTASQGLLSICALSILFVMYETLK